MIKRPIHTLIFDLSEVLISGLVGIEKPLSTTLHQSKKTILAAFGGERLKQICRGELSEEAYLEQIIAEQQWELSIDTLKKTIRQNLQQRVEGMEPLVTYLIPRYQLVLHSDHAVEWVTYLRQAHPFLDLFDPQFFSFDLKHTKDEPAAFQTMLEKLGQAPDTCLFIDDNPRNVRTAEAVGLAGIHFINAAHLRGELAERGIIQR